MVVELRPHQKEAVEKLSNGKILWGGMGTGKTITSLAYFYTKVCGGVVGDLSSMQRPRDLYVITTARVRDDLNWEKEAAKLAIGKERDASVAGIKLTVDSWNNVHKYMQVKDAFFIFDEQRVVGTGKWVKAFIKIAKQNQWILLSATPGDTWLDYAPVMIANGWYKNITEFKRRHVVYNTFSKFPKVDRYVEVGRLVKLRNHLLVEMPYARHTTRHEHMIEVGYDQELFNKVVKDRWHVYENRPLKDVGEMFRVMRKVVNTDDTRVAEIRSLLSRHPKLIVFYNFDYELEKLRELGKEMARESVRESVRETSTSLTLSGTSPKESTNSTPNSGSRPTPQSSSIPTESDPHSSEKISKLDSASRSTTGSGGSSSTMSSGRGDEVRTSSFSRAEWNGHRHEPIPKTDRWLYLVQYVAGAEGWNCTDTDAMAFYSLTYSYKNWHQAYGRIDRLNTPFKDLHYYILKSKAAIDLGIWKALRGKKNFNEADFGRSWGSHETSKAA